MFEFLHTITQFVNINFLIFLGISVILYYLLRRSITFLLAASIFFYSTYSYTYTIVILILCLITWALGLLLAKQKRKNKSLFVISIVIIVGTLAFFRYKPFIEQTVGSIGIPLNLQAPILIPLGISFFSFELLHYIIDVYRGKKAIRNLQTFLLFPFFFPTQLAGPIKRFESFVPQLSKTTISFDQIEDGLFLIIKGFFKKIVLADTLAKIVVFDPAASPLILLVSIYAFSWQIYYDFSGYTDIGRGAAKLFGINVPQNFMQPYLAGNIKDFWRRWHMSLMKWFTDYIYIPLGGNRKGAARTYLNVFIVFAISGLWHGPAWHFVIWGIYHAALMVGHTMLEPFLIPIRKTVPKAIYTALSIFVTFNAVTLGWVLFRAPSFQDALTIYKKLLNFTLPLPTLNTDTFLAIALLCCYGFSLLFLKTIVKNISFINIYGKYFVYGASIVIMIVFQAASSPQFIYFQF